MNRPRHIGARCPRRPAEPCGRCAAQALGRAALRLLLPTVWLAAGRTAAQSTNAASPPVGGAAPSVSSGGQGGRPGWHAVVVTVFISLGAILCIVAGEGLAWHQRTPTAAAGEHAPGLAARCAEAGRDQPAARSAASACPRRRRDGQCSHQQQPLGACPPAPHTSPPNSTCHPPAVTLMIHRYMRRVRQRMLAAVADIHSAELAAHEVGWGGGGGCVTDARVRRHNCAPRPPMGPGYTPKCAGSSAFPNQTASFPLPRPSPPGRQLAGRAALARRLAVRVAAADSAGAAGEGARGRA